MIICVLLGSIVGTFFGVFLTTDDMNLYRNGIKDLQTECHSIINTFKKCKLKDLGETLLTSLIYFVICIN